MLAAEEYLYRIWKLMGGTRVDTLADVTVINGSKNVATAGTAVPIGPDTPLTAGVRVKAKHANTGWIYVGDINVNSGNGYVLDAAEEVFIEVGNLNKVYINSSVNLEGVTFVGS